VVLSRAARHPDCAPGLIGALETTFRQSLRQRCLIHRCRNIVAKVPVSAQAEVKAAFWGIFATRYAKVYPAAIAYLEDDFASLTEYLRFPRQHWKRIRHSNFIERTFGETRRRVKVIGRLPGEASCLSLVWAVLDRAGRGWRGVTQTSESIRLLQDLRR